jgi:ParB-like chromosome segregation protein Spo0J
MNLLGLPKDVFATLPHPAAELFPLMPDDQLRDLAEDIKKNGLNYPIVVFEGKILDGRNRLRACKLAGVKPGFHPFERREFDEKGELVREVTPLEFVLSSNLHRRHLTGEQRREIVAKLLKEKPDRPDRQVAAKVGVDHKTVGKVRQEMKGRGEIPHVERRTDSKGRSQPAARERSIKDAEAAKITHSDRTARQIWFGELTKALSWAETWVADRTDSRLAWYTEAGEPGAECDIDPSRIDAAIAQLARVRDITFARRK